MTDPLDQLDPWLADVMRAQREACSVPCPTCGVGAGRLCRGTDVRTDTHPSRQAAVARRKEVPLS